MVTLLTDYSTQRYILNSGDDLDGIEFHNGDQILLMDQDVLLIFDEEGNNWNPVPTGGGGSAVHAIIGTSVSATNSFVIPKEDGYNNFFAYVSEPDADYFSTAGRSISCYQLAWENRVSGIRSSGTNFPPTAIAGTLVATSLVTETSSSISVKCNNANTNGVLPDGMPVTYILW